MSYGSERFAFGYTLTPWVKRLLIANTAVHLLVVVIRQFVGLEGQLFVWNWFGFTPAESFLKPWGAVTYMFLHGDIWHLLLNMLVLFFFGPPLEQRWGSDRFLKYYLICGLGGAVLSFVFAFGTSVIGASAAIYGLMLAFAWYWPNAPIYFWGIFPIKAKYLVGFFFVLTFFSAVGGAGGGVAHFAHLGGLLAGLIYLRTDGKWGDGLDTLKKAARVERLAIVPREDKGEERAEGSRRRTSGRSDSKMGEKELLDEVDRILDKISDSGISSLSDDERRVLDEVSRRRRTN
ncbi:MAG: rhomboid family intramembrane serine protease [Gemmatimonadales bacterium]|nr:MAG: rhomboid family intramembrane serine protease [Gemmatimonadales bacterium]